MNIQEFYTSIDPTGKQYESVMSRLGTERLVNKYLKKMTDDKSYENLKNAVASGNYKDAFMASHTIKGICMNLSLDILAESSSALTEELRDDPDPARVSVLFRQVEEDYKIVTDGIKSIE